MKTALEQLMKIIPERMSYDSDRVTFLENDSSLEYDGAAVNFRNMLVDRRIKHNVVGNLPMMTAEHLIDVVKNTLDGILAFETTGSSDSFARIYQIVTKLSNEGYRFTLIECYINEPVVRRIPDEAHDSLRLFSLDCYDKNLDNWFLTEQKKRSK